jgi:serine/threonine-protein kinase
MSDSPKDAAGETRATVTLSGAGRDGFVAGAPERGKPWWQFLGFKGSRPTRGPTTPLPADDLTWRYREAREIARGGMGIIFQVRDKSLDRESAMKVALPAILREPTYAALFVGEAQITAQLEHPNIVPVHDFGQTPDHALYYTMKLVQGEPLTHVLDRIRLGNPDYARRFTRHQRLLIFRKVCDAVAFAHSQGIVHRDIKPENIMVGAYGEVLLMDWGLAKKVGDPTPSAPATGRVPAAESAAPATATASGMVKGTPAYMSPEQALGRTHDIDYQTDVFLLGATLYHMVTFVPPYSGATADEVIGRAALGYVTPPADICPQEMLPDDLCRIIRRAMEPNKKRRYPAVEELISDLDDFMSGRTLSMRRTFKPGEFLMRAGEVGMEGYVILSGQVEVVQETDGRRIQLGLLGPGDVVGEMAIVTHEARSASVAALQPTEVEVITAEIMKNEMGKLAPWMDKLVNALARRLRLANSNVHPLILGDCTCHVANQLLLLAAWRSPSTAGDCELPLSDIEQEISRNLAVPVERTREGLVQLADRKLVQLHLANGTCTLNREALERHLASCRSAAGSDLVPVPKAEEQEVGKQ